MSAGLEEMALRCEAATGPDRELDGAIEAIRARYPEGWSRESFIASATVEFHHVGNGRVGIRTDNGLDHVRWDAPAYTASLDAAITLVPDASQWIVVSDDAATVFRRGERAKRYGNMEDMHDGVAATPALALCAAALRAQANTNG